MSPRADAASRALLFDLDGVLLDSAGAYRRAWLAWARCFGIDDALIWRDAHGRRPQDIIKRVAPQVTLEPALGVFEAALAGEGADGVRPFSGAAALLGLLGAGFWAIVSSGHRSTVTSWLRITGLPEPSVLVTAEDVVRGKPDPACFLVAARRLTVDPKRCLVIEDAPIGLDAALAAGMPAVAVETTHPADVLRRASRTFSSLDQAAPHLLSWLS